VTNFNEPGVFIYRISGVEPTDPRRPEGDDYEYQQVKIVLYFEFFKIFFKGNSGIRSG